MSGSLTRRDPAKDPLAFERCLGVAALQKAINAYRNRSTSLVLDEVDSAGN
jgi:hypothetical protein